MTGSSSDPSPLPPGDPRTAPHLRGLHRGGSSLTPREARALADRISRDLSYVREHYSEAYRAVEDVRFPSGSGSGRSQLQYSDPTAAAVFDGHRRSGALKEADAALKNAAEALEQAAEALSVVAYGPSASRITSL